MKLKKFFCSILIIFIFFAGNAFGEEVDNWDFYIEYMQENKTKRLLHCSTELKTFKANSVLSQVENIDRNDAMEIDGEYKRNR